MNDHDALWNLRHIVGYAYCIMRANKDVENTGNNTSINDDQLTFLPNKCARARAFTQTKAAVVRTNERAHTHAHQSWPAEENQGIGYAL